MKYLFIILVFLTGCMTLKQADKYCIEKNRTHVTDTTELVTIIKDTIVYSESDSAWISLLVECADTNEALIKKLQSGSTAGMKTEFIYRDKIIYLKAKSEPQAISVLMHSFSHKEKYTKATTAVEYREKPFKWWVKFLMWSGVALYALLFLFFIYVIIKVKLKKL